MPPLCSVIGFLVLLLPLADAMRWIVAQGGVRGAQGAFRPITQAPARSRQEAQRTIMRADPKVRRVSVASRGDCIAGRPPGTTPAGATAASSLNRALCLRTFAPALHHALFLLDPQYSFESETEDDEEEAEEVMEQVIEVDEETMAALAEVESSSKLLTAQQAAEELALEQVESEFIGMFENNDTEGSGEVIKGDEAVLAEAAEDEKSMQNAGMEAALEATVSMRSISPAVEAAMLTLAADTETVADGDVSDKVRSRAGSKVGKDEITITDDAKEEMKRYKLSKTALQSLVPADWDTMNIEWFSNNKNEATPLPEFRLQFLWTERNIAVSLDQTFARGSSAPLTEYFFWPRRDAWEDMKFWLEARPWISER